jgi:hypothetical protein
MLCPNCSKSIRTENGMAFHRSWCKPAAPAADAPARAVAAPARKRGHNERNHAEAMSWRMHRMERRRKAAAARRERIAHPSALAEHEAAITAADTLASDLPALRKPSSPHKARTIVPAREPIPKLAKLPATGKGKHARCVAHVPMVRSEPGIAYACFDVAPDQDAIADRRAFIDAIDASIAEHRAIVEARRLAPEVSAAALALVGRTVDTSSRLKSESERAANREQSAAEMAEWRGGAIRCPLDTYPNTCYASRNGLPDDAGLLAHFVFRHADAELPEAIAA